MRVVVNGEKALEKYLGAWGHMLIASNDLIDMMHEHPFLADAVRAWNTKWCFHGPGRIVPGCSFKAQGVVDTARFALPVAPAPEDPPD